mgnify:CR=1 FL=1
MYPRFAAEAVRTALSDSRVVLIVGPRQAGKSTLAKHGKSDANEAVLHELIEFLCVQKLQIYLDDASVADGIITAADQMLAATTQVR